MQIKIGPLGDGGPPTGDAPTIVFIDYESLYYSLQNVFGAKPDLKELVADFRTIGKIAAIKVFGDFTKAGLEQERNRVRTITNFIIDCSYETAAAKKDFTDFIMLDHIYQEVIQNEAIKQFVLVTGDGHFSSAATFLRMYMDRGVGVYSVAKTLSRQLRDCSTWVRVIDILDDTEEEYMRKIAYSLKRAEDGGKYATFMRTCEFVHQYHNGDQEICTRVLRKMIDEGLVISEPTTSFNGQEIRRLYVNKDKIGKILPE
ncbi:MAG: NYN domain-containing protein [Oscillospiraceae bacterium]|jgi:uncharacterized LabA/DUF88 family protein|nr:NYN domain-containing protein [Oscillospiraceae bacterium]